ncbi:microfibril-associated glycoprotein 4-like [Drosophila nasuta]|uniref:microfibril-associated glycoprotein 4-like n=1 Tax=Drosophila nasuta TaxID=42062 RepID=UPI00295E54F7|nr:microfibril-associated glycoprotein 4-like [Drosophila nasuta]
MTAKMKFFIYILFLKCFTLSVATETEDNKVLNNLLESKLISIIDLQGILGALELNATYKNIKTLNIGSKANDNSNVLGLLQKPNFNVEEQMQRPDYKAKKPLQTEKALSTDETATAVKQLKAQVDNLQLSVFQLQNLVNSNANKPKSCLTDKGRESNQVIRVPGVDAFRVVCDTCAAGPGWIVIQRRFDGSLDFYRDWNAYRFGFGYYDGEFFLGLEYIHHLTISRPYELYIELIDFENQLYFARYDNFLIGSAEEKFALKSLGTYNGNAGDALSYNLYDKFSTYDSDNDNWLHGNCANYYESGWWFGSDTNSNLNGRYYKWGQRNARGIWWYTLRGYNSLKSVKMLIRPKYTLV